MNGVVELLRFRNPLFLTGVSSVDDITARHLAKVVESSDDAIVSKDLNSIITSWNPGAERIFGFTAEEAIGKSIRIVIPADRQNEEDAVMARIRRGEKIDHYETIRQRKDGSRITISLTVSPIRDDHGAVIGASKIARDVSERVRLQAELREHAVNSQKLSAVGAVVASTLDRETIVQKVTDTATELTHAEFGAFFYNARDQHTGDAYMLYALSGAPREAFASFQIRALRRCSVRRSGAKGRCGSPTSSPIHATARARRTTACQRDTCRSAATSRFRSRVSMVM